MSSDAIAAPPVVSVIVNCYNGAKFLRQALDSIFSQTLPQFEVIFWDNASTDDSATIARSYDQRLRYFRSEVNVHLGEARRHAMAVCEGEFIGFLDVDDVYHPHALETLTAAMKTGPWSIVYGAVRLVDEMNCVLRLQRPRPASGSLFERLLHQFDIYLPATLLRRQVFVDEGLTFDPLIVASEDYCLFMQMAARTGVRAIDTVVGDYRVHNASLTSVAIAEWATERDYTLDRILAHDPSLADQYRSAFREARARARYYRARWLFSNAERIRALRELLPVMLVSPRYALLVLLLITPGPAWTLAHEWKTKRRLGG